MQPDILAGSRALQLATPAGCRLTLLREPPATHHDRVAGAIETVISRRGLDMLHGHPGSFQT
jgi:hypothetical protein